MPCVLGSDRLVSRLATRATHTRARVHRKGEARRALRNERLYRSSLDCRSAVAVARCLYHRAHRRPHASAGADNRVQRAAAAAAAAAARRRRCPGAPGPRGTGAPGRQATPAARCSCWLPPDDGCVKAAVAAVAAVAADRNRHSLAAAVDGFAYGYGPVSNHFRCRCGVAQLRRPVPRRVHTTDTATAETVSTPRPLAGQQQRENDARREMRLTLWGR